MELLMSNSVKRLFHLYEINDGWNTLRPVDKNSNCTILNDHNALTVNKT